MIGIFLLLLLDRCHVDEGGLFEGTCVPANLFVGEGNESSGDRVERVVRTHLYVFARSDLGSALTNDDATNVGEFSGVELGPEALAMGIASVRCRTTGLFVCHRVLRS